MPPPRSTRRFTALDFPPARPVYRPEGGTLPLQRLPFLILHSLEIELLCPRIQTSLALPRRWPKQPGQNRENLKNTCRFRLLAAYAAAQLHEESKESQKSSDSPISGLDRVACQLCHQGRPYQSSEPTQTCVREMSPRAILNREGTCNTNR